MLDQRRVGSKDDQERLSAGFKVDRANLQECGDEGAIVRISWATEQLRGGHIVRFSRLDELPEQASIDRQSYQRSGTQSDLSLPLRAGESRLGVLSFDSIREERTWPDGLQSRLQLLAEIFTGALADRAGIIAKP
jgi:transcriptional regulator with GAF, ATPase, and Fis domain